MRRLVVAISMLLVSAPAGVMAADVVDRPVLRARVVTCQTGADPANRYAVFAGSMPALPSSPRMEMRFDLLQRHPGAAGYARIPLPHWGQWERTDRPGIVGFVFTKRVEQLAAPAVYRAVIRFRWYDGDGNLVRSAKRLSAPCRQLDPRPDLAVGDVAGASDGRYLVDVLNQGRDDATPFWMSFEVEGSTVSLQVPGVPAGETRTVAVTAPRCSRGEQVSIALDTADDIQEADELDDAVSRPCPFGTR
jgi:hypothetical protein